MGKGMLTNDELILIKQNPNVSKATQRQIFYTEDFKESFRKAYGEGKGPTQIFREAGFDPKVLGYKRIERAAARWR